MGDEQFDPTASVQANSGPPAPAPNYLSAAQPNVEPAGTYPQNAIVPSRNLGQYQPPQQQQGGVRGMLTNFFKNLAPAIADPNYVSPQRAEQLRAQYTQAETAKAQATTAQTAAQTKLLTTQVQTPWGPMPEAYWKAIGPAVIRAGQSNVNNQRSNDTHRDIANQNLARFGYKIDEATGNPTPMSDGELSPQQRSLIGVHDAMAEYTEAKTKQLPDQMKIALGKLDVALAGLGLKKQELGIQAFKAGLGAPTGAGQVPGLPGVPHPDSQQFSLLSPTAQKTLQDTIPVHQQIKDLMQKFEKSKDDNTPFKHASEAAKYKLGISSEAGEAGDTIAQLNLNRVVGSARILKGSSRAIQALELGMQHLPDVWKDSDKLIYGKLSNIDKALTQVEQSATTYGAKSGRTPEPNSAVPSQGGGVSEPAQGGGDFFSKFGGVKKGK